MIPRLTPRRIAAGAGLGAALPAAASLLHPAAGVAVAAPVIAAFAIALAAVTLRARLALGREAFRQELERALSACGDEEATARVGGIAFASVLPGAPGDLLLTDRERTRLDRVSAAPAGAAGCPVQQLGDCAALRTGSLQVFRSSSDLGACAMLRDRQEGPLSAICAPVGFVSVPLGVMHLTAPDGTEPSRETVQRLAL
ncbi:MAG: hypothetical protein FJ104_14395, partial [Deltaproteobacteria bacterium]|nr:hypothetical protein [Deltaproteobacteria bacterium]